MAPKLLLLGGSNGQLHAARRARERGICVILADYTEHPPAAQYADVHERCSTFDWEACLQAARSHRVDGVLAVGTDQPVLTAALIAQAMKLPTAISVETALRATNKRAMKEAFERFHIPNAPHRFVTREACDAGDLSAPYVLKPLDSQGQRGVLKLSGKADIAPALPATLSFSRLPEALLESYYPSDELTLSGWLHQGVLYPLTLTDRQHYPSERHIGVCVAHRYPSIHKEVSDEANRLSLRVAQALGAREGPIYIQFLLGKQGLVVNEAALRIGGAFEDVFIPRLTGFDILDAQLRMALGEAPNACMGTLCTAAKPQSLAAEMSTQLFFIKEGVPQTRTPIDLLRALPGVVDAGYNFALGQAVPPFSDATARYGYAVLLCGKGEMQALVRAFYESVHVQDAFGNELLIPQSY
ncbi:MAG: carboxylate--amine ligase [Clostridia bacterium]